MKAIKDLYKKTKSDPSASETPNLTALPGGENASDAEPSPEAAAIRSEAQVRAEFERAIEMQSPRMPRTIIRTTGALLLVAFVWAAFASLEEVARGEGKVIPSSQIQVVQAPERGNISELLIREGDVVEKGQIVAKIDETSFASRLGEIRQKRWTLLARVERLKAEINGSEPNFTNDLVSNSELATLTEMALFRSRQLKLKDEKSVLRQQLTQRREEREELLAKQKKLSDTIELNEKEMEIKTRLYKRRVIPEIEYLQIQRQSIDLKGELAITTSGIKRIEAGIHEAEERLQSVGSSYLAEAYENLAESQAELAVLEETLKDAQHRLKGTDIRSPVRGIVNRLHVATIGAVVQPGENLVDIVPLDDRLLIEARIRPDNIAFLHPGLDAQVRITAYDSTVYGGLDGKLYRIAADTTEDEKGNIYYKVTVETDKNYLGTEADPLPIIPGMVASVDILTGSKTVLEYLVQPIQKIRAEALRER